MAVIPVFLFQRAALAASAAIALMSTILPAAPAVPAELFFQGATFMQPRLSPDGRRLAALSRFDYRHYALSLVDLHSGKAEVLIKDPKLSVDGHAWKGDDLLVVVVSDEYGRRVLQSVDLRTRRANSLDRLNEQGDLPIASFLPGHPTDVICVWGDGTLRRVNVQTGKSTEIERRVLGIDRWIIDAQGQPWAGIGYLGEKWIFIWRREVGEAWQRREQPGRQRATIYPFDIMPQGGRLVVAERMPTGRDRLAYFDLRTGSTEQIFADPHVDIVGMSYWGFNGNPAFAVYDTDREHLHGFHPVAAACYRMLAEALPGSDCRMVSFSRDEQRMIIEAAGAREPGSFYLLDRGTGKLGLIGKSQSALAEDTLAPARWFEFRARDGLQVSGQIILPGGSEPPPLLLRLGPSLVGPRGWNRYDAEAQFLASRGFATAIIHARGTEGFGREHLEAGDLKICSTVLDDLQDGIAFLAAQGWINPARVGVFGKGEGGIVALHAAVRGGFKVWVNLGTPMSVQKWDLHQLCPSDRDNEELTRMVGGSAAANAYIKSLEPIAAVAKLRVPSFHAYPRGQAGYEMIESGRMVVSALRKMGLPHAVHLESEMKPDSDVAKNTGARFEALEKFLRDHL